MIRRQSLLICNFIHKHFCDRDSSWINKKANCIDFYINRFMIYSYDSTGSLCTAVQLGITFRSTKGNFKFSIKSQQHLDDQINSTSRTKAYVINSSTHKKRYILFLVYYYINVDHSSNLLTTI